MVKTADVSGAPLSATDAVILGLRRSILSGALPGGSRVLQDEVAMRYRVSQSIVREAFRQLSAEGLLRSEPRRGMSVVGMSLDDAGELVRLRRAVEVQALELAVPRLGPESLAQAEKTLRQLDKADDAEDILTLNAAFHDTLYAPSEQRRTLALVATLRHAYDRYFRLLCDETGHVPQSQAEHWELLRRCQAGDVQGACQLLDAHIAATLDSLAARLGAPS